MQTGRRDSWGDLKILGFSPHGKRKLILRIIMRELYRGIRNAIHAVIVNDPISGAILIK